MQYLAPLIRTLLGVTLFLASFNANLKSQCSDASLNVTTNLNPGDRCGANTEQFSISNAPSFDEIRWKPGNGTSWTSVNTSESYNYQNPGTYTPKAAFLDANGNVICEASASPITIFDNPEADFEVLSPKVQCLPNNKFELQSTSRKSVTGAPITNWAWTMGIGSKNGPNVNQSYATAGKYDVTLQITDTNGCTDLVVKEVVAQVVEENVSYDTVSKAFCNHFHVPSGDTTLTESTIYTDTIVNSVGCDSLITFDLIAINTACSSIDTSVCDSFQVPTSGKVLTESTNHLDTVTNSRGSDSIIAYNVTVEVPQSQLYTRNPEVCVATVDDGSNFNVIIWERTSKTGVVGYNIYRQGVSGFNKVVAVISTN